jgi:xanthine phosphoribosyltransferase
MDPMAKTPSTKRYREVSWEELHSGSRELAGRLRMLGKWERIIAVARGGLVPAAIIGRELGIKHIDTVCVSSYKGEKQGKHTIIKGATGAGAGLLIIDDLVDTGKTAQLLKKMLPDAHLATVFAKPVGIPHVDTFITKVSQNTWIVFPWDKR